MATARRRKAGVSRISVTFDGPFFDGPYRQQIIHQFQDRVKVVVAQMGNDILRARFARTFKHPTGHFAGALRVERAQKYNDQVISDFVIYGPWLEGTTTRNKTTRFKGYKNFRRTRLELRKKVQPIAQEMLDRYLERLR